jgi:hypothetical protein
VDWYGHLGVLLRRCAGLVEEPTGRGLVGGAHQNSNAGGLQLELRLLSPGVVGDHRCFEAMAAQEAGDQFCLRAAAHARHGGGLPTRAEGSLISCMLSRDHGATVSRPGYPSHP